MTWDARRAFSGALAILTPVLDILDGRVEDAAPPPWCLRRGWKGFLLSLDDEALHRCEAEGLAEALADGLPGAPADLAALAAGVRAATRLPAAVIDAREIEGDATREVPARKRAQLAALLGAVGAMAASAARIVDVGAGSGHFTRLAAGMFERESLGIERDAARVAAAADRARAHGAGAARFVAADACREPLALGPGDLAVGLHACGGLGDRLAVAAGEAGCDLALVSCCLQKIDDAARAPLSRAGAGLVLGREVLGLANLTSAPLGVEVSLEATLTARQARYGLRSLLRERGIVVAPGDEMGSLNRRRARAGLADLAARACALRGLAPPSAEEILRHEAEAARGHGVVRRLSLPRNMLARLVEVAVVLDRAAALEERGHAVVVATLCDRAVTPRNIAVFASREPARLPLTALAT